MLGMKFIRNWKSPLSEKVEKAKWELDEMGKGELGMRRNGIRRSWGKIRRNGNKEKLEKGDMGMNPTNHLWQHS
jgi:hypothetical protein